MRCLLTYKFIKREDDHYVNITYEGNTIRLPLNIPLNVKNPNTWSVFPIRSDDPNDPILYALNATEWRKLKGKSRQTSQTIEPTNAMIYEQLIQLNANYTQMNANYTRLSADVLKLHNQCRKLLGYSHTMYDWVDRVDSRVHEMYQITQRIDNWHISQDHYEVEPSQPRSVPERPRRRQPRQDQPSSSHGPID